MFVNLISWQTMLESMEKLKRLSLIDSAVNAERFLERQTDMEGLAKIVLCIRRIDKRLTD
jgi:hypothetical protein